MCIVLHGNTTPRLHKLSRNTVVQKVKTKALIKSPNSLQLDLNKHSIFIMICMEVSYIDMTVISQSESPPNCEHCLLTLFLLPTLTSFLRSTPEGCLFWGPKLTWGPHTWDASQTLSQYWETGAVSKARAAHTTVLTRKDLWRNILHIHSFWDQKELQYLQLIMPAYGL